MLRHLWQYDLSHYKYVCFPEPIDDQELNKSGICRGCGLEVAEHALENVPLSDIPPKILRGHQNGSTAMLAVALDYLTAEGKV